jgi:hypothetical protein
LQASLNEYWTPFAKILFCDLSLSPPESDIDVRDLFSFFKVLSGEYTVYRDADLSDCGPFLRIPNFRVTGEVAYQHDAI